MEIEKNKTKQKKDLKKIMSVKNIFFNYIRILSKFKIN